MLLLISSGKFMSDRTLSGKPGKAKRRRKEKESEEKKIEEKRKAKKIEGRKRRVAESKQEDLDDKNEPDWQPGAGDRSENEEESESESEDEEPDELPPEAIRHAVNAMFVAKEFPPPELEIRESPRYGKGLFATRDIRGDLEGEGLWTYGGSVIFTLGTLEKRSPSGLSNSKKQKGSGRHVSDKIIEITVWNNRNRIWIDGDIWKSEPGDPRKDRQTFVSWTALINHKWQWPGESPVPPAQFSAVFANIIVTEDGKMHAVRDIKKDEELSFDYGTRYWRGDTGARGRIRPVWDWSALTADAATELWSLSKENSQVGRGLAEHVNPKFTEIINNRQRNSASQMAESLAQLSLHDGQASSSAAAAAAAAAQSHMDRRGDGGPEFCRECYEAERQQGMVHRHESSGYPMQPPDARRYYCWPGGGGGWGGR